MNDYREENPFCYFHPKEKVVGICAHCLKERLQILASKQGNYSLPKDITRTHSRKSTLSIPKIFALGSFLHRPSKSVDLDDDTSTSQEDSFISIKFEKNGIASWDKGTDGKVCGNESKVMKESNKSVVEHVKPQSVLKWRKRIGQLLQHVRWKRSTKANVCHVGTKVGGVKVRRGWIRTLTKRRTME